MGSTIEKVGLERGRGTAFVIPRVSVPTELELIPVAPSPTRAMAMEGRELGIESRKRTKVADGGRLPET